MTEAMLENAIGSVMTAAPGDPKLGALARQFYTAMVWAALSPRSADGLCSLAAKAGAAAPPQAPVAGSEDAASEVAG